MTQIKQAPIEDLNFILQELPFEIRQESILLTGGTGFFGKWLTQTLLAINDQRNAGNQIFILTRDRDRALRELPWLSGRKDIELIESDVRSLKSPSTQFSTIIHGATSANRTLNENSPWEMFETIVDGTKAVLKIAEKCGCRRFQLISSGAIYGRQPANMDHIQETYSGAPSPEDISSAYGLAKRSAEFLAISTQQKVGFHLSIPRGFAFLGPYLPLHTHFAAGNFIAAVLENKPILINGDGRAIRSYLYSADLMIWLMKMLRQPDPVSILNIGSDHALSIRELAQKIHTIGCKLQPARERLKGPIQIAMPPQSEPAHRYVPDVAKAHQRLGVREWTPLEKSIEKVLLWYLRDSDSLTSP